MTQLQRTKDILKGLEMRTIIMRQTNLSGGRIKCFAFVVEEKVKVGHDNVVLGLMQHTHA